MKIVSIKDTLWVLIRRVFYRGARTLNANEREGLRQALRIIVGNPKLLIGMLVTGLLAALFEGGTLGILGLSVGVATGESSELLNQLPAGAKNVVTAVQSKLGNEKTFLFLVGIAIGAQILKSILTFFSTALHIILSSAVELAAQRKTTKQILSMGFSQVSAFPKGRLAMLIDEAGVVSTLANEIGKTSRAVLMAIVYLAVMLFMSLMFTLLSTLIFFVIWLVLTKITIVVKKLSRLTVAADIDTWRWTVEFLNSPRLLHIFNAQEHAENSIHGARLRRVLAERKKNVINAAVVPTFEVITVIAAGMFLVFGYMFAGDHAMAIVPTLFVFILVFFRLKPQIKTINDARVTLADLIPKFEVIGELFREEIEVPKLSKGTSFKKVAHGIELKNVSFTYPGTQKECLKNIDLFVPRGQTIAIVGESGSGKSTIVDLILGLYTPTEGNVFIDNYDLATISISNWRNKLGVVDQEVFLLNCSVLDNIKFGRLELTSSDVEKAIRTSKADEFIQQLEQGIETVIGDRGYRLSGGQQQRIALARALVSNPDVLILDEATSALDSVSEKLIQKSIEAMHHERTILVIAHRLATIEKADKIIVLDDGEIVEQGTREELVRKRGKFFDAWSSQVGEISN